MNIVGYFCLLCAWRDKTEGLWDPVQDVVLLCHPSEGQSNESLSLGISGLSRLQLLKQQGNRVLLVRGLGGERERGLGLVPVLEQGRLLVLEQEREREQGLGWGQVQGWVKELGQAPDGCHKKDELETS